MTDAYTRKVDRTKAVLTDTVRDDLGKGGLNLLYDAIMIMAFADGDVSDDETRFLNDFAEFINCQGSDEDLTDESLLERLSEIQCAPSSSEAILKVLLIVTDLDDNIDDDEMRLWKDIGRTLGITKERLIQIRKLV